jgi:DNA polymerase I-like protein with 3'-5' exonuclease and polymerase domains
VSADRAERLRRWAEANGYGGTPAPAPRPTRREGDDFTVLDIETTSRAPWSGELVAVGIGSTAYRSKEGRRRAAKLMASDAVVVCHTDFDLRWLALDGLELGPGLRFHDTRVMAWLLDPDMPSYALDDLCASRLGFTPDKLIRRRAGVIMFESPTVGLVRIEEAPWDELAAYNESDLDATAQLYVDLRDALIEAGSWDVFVEHEVPLLRELVRMQARGLPFYDEGREELRVKVRAEHEELADELREMAGAPAAFNLRSPDQVGRYLFSPKREWVELKDRIAMTPAMQLVAKAAAKDETVDAVQAVAPKGFAVERVGRTYAHGVWRIRGRGLASVEKKTSSGRAGIERLRAGKTLKSGGHSWSTSSNDLVLKHVDDEWVQAFVLWRELDKLEGSFLSKFPEFVHEGRLYGTVNRCGTATGRFSSREPNLQQIPAHGRYGPDVRALFRGDLAIGDYAQLEQRITAHYSKDENLLKAYREDIDLYGLAASLLFGGEPTKDHEYRGLLKTTMLSLAYGAGYFKLAQLMTRGGHETDPDGAKELVGRIRDAFSAMFQWRDEVVFAAIETGYAETIDGRRRPFDFDEGWHEFRVTRDHMSYVSDDDFPGAGRNLILERQASNYVVQGSAAALVARAMVAAANDAEGDEYRTLLQVHDEVLWERGEDWRGDESLEKLRHACEVGHGFDLIVPIKFDPSAVTDWSAKGVSQTGEGHIVKDRLAKARGEGMQARKASDYAADVLEMRRKKKKEAA